MTKPSKEPEPWSRQDEDNLALEIAEDARLRRLGIDPDGDSIQIMLEIDRLKDGLTPRDDKP